MNNSPRSFVRRYEARIPPGTCYTWIDWANGLLVADKEEAFDVASETSQVRKSLATMRRKDGQAPIKQPGQPIAGIDQELLSALALDAAIHTHVAAIAYLVSLIQAEQGGHTRLPADQEARDEMYLVARNLALSLLDAHDGDLIDAICEFRNYNNLEKQFLRTAAARIPHTAEPPPSLPPPPPFPDDYPALEMALEDMLREIWPAYHHLGATRLLDIVVTEGKGDLKKVSDLLRAADAVNS